jgi:RluA family pseudouridine synthase
MIRHFISEKNEPIVDFLNQQLGINSDKSIDLLKFGAVYLNKNRQRVPVDLKITDYIRVHTEPRRFPVSQIDWKKTLIFENEEFVVVNKPSGIPTHATVANLFENVIEQMKICLGIELYVLNRLDVATNGILVLAKTKKFQTAFNNALRDSKVTKYYSAIVENHLHEPQTLIHYMKNDYTQPKVMSDEPQEGFQICKLQILEAQPFTSEEGFPLTKVRIHLYTGRTHQIRAQLSRIGHPVVGDKLYGSRSPWNEKEEVSLTSSYLKFQIFEEFEFSL